MSLKAADPGEGKPLDDSGRLAVAARSGDALAFAQLLELKYDLIFRMAWRWSGNREDGEDIAQDVCIRLGKVIGSWRADSAFDTWLHQLVLNAARDHLRRRSRQTRLSEAVKVHLLMEEAETMPNDNPTEALWDAVRQLPPKQCDAVLLVHGEGLSHALAAAAMQCSESTVSWHIHEARKRLKDILKAGGSHD